MMEELFAMQMWTLVAAVCHICHLAVKAWGLNYTFTPVHEMTETSRGGESQGCPSMNKAGWCKLIKEKKKGSPLSCCVWNVCIDVYWWWLQKNEDWGNFLVWKLLAQCVTAIITRLYRCSQSHLIWKPSMYLVSYQLLYTYHLIRALLGGLVDP